MSFLALNKRRSSKSLSHQRSKSAIDSSCSLDLLSQDGLSDVDLSPPPSPPGTIRRKLYRKKSTSPTGLPRQAEEPRRPAPFRWPTGDPSRPTGTISFDPSPPASPQLSPTKEKWAFLSSFKNEPDSPTKAVSRPLSALSDWFQGESAPISLGISTSRDDNDDDTNMDLRPGFLRRSSTLTSSRSRSPTKSLSSPSTSRFGFLTSAAKALSPAAPAAPVPQEADENDEFLQLDIKAALLPNGESDPFSPSSFKNLLQNAEGVLTRLQAAYEQRFIAVAQAQAELTAQKEETEETQTRVQHLKQQLNDLSAQNAQKDEIINDLLADIKNEKTLREEDLAARARSIRVVDLPQKRQRGGRQSTGSSAVSDSGFESNNEEEEESRFYASSTSLSSLVSAPHVGHARQTSVSRVSPTIIHNITSPKIEKPGCPTTSPELGAMEGNNFARNIGSKASGECNNCGGLNPSAAWGMVGNVREENTVLKERNKHLESELAAVLEMVNGILGH